METVLVTTLMPWLEGEERGLFSAWPSQPAVFGTVPSR